MSSLNQQTISNTAESNTTNELPALRLFSAMKVDGIMLITGYVRSMGKINQKVPTDITKFIDSYWRNIKIEFQWISITHSSESSNKASLKVSGDRNETIEFLPDYWNDGSEPHYFKIQDGINFNDSFGYKYILKIQCTKHHKRNGGGRRCSHKPRIRLNHICAGIGIYNQVNKNYIGYECCPYTMKGKSAGHKLFKANSFVDLETNDPDGETNEGYIRNGDILKLVVDTKSKMMDLYINGVCEFSDKIKANEDAIFDICLRLSFAKQYITVKKYSCVRLS